MAVLGTGPGPPVWHCAVRARPGTPTSGTAPGSRSPGKSWTAPACRAAARDHGVRWIAVHHGGNHIHIVATLARQDGRRARRDNDYYRIGEALRDIEKEYGLQVVARADRTAAKSPDPGRAGEGGPGRREPARVTLRRQVAAAAARTRSEPEFFAELGRRGVQVRLRHSTRHPAEVTGYAVALPGNLTAAGDLIWYGGGKLAPDLTLPKLRRRWAPAGHRGPRPRTGPASGPGCPGAAWATRPARAVLRREAAGRGRGPVRAGVLHRPGRAGLLVRLRDDPARPGRVAGYAVSLPGLIRPPGRPPGLVRRAPPWVGTSRCPRCAAAGRPASPVPPPGPAVFPGPAPADIYRYAAGVASAAARQLAGRARHPSRPPTSPGPPPTCSPRPPR